MNIKAITMNEMNYITANIKYYSINELIIFNNLKQLIENHKNKTIRESYYLIHKEKDKEKAIKKIYKLKMKINKSEIKHFIEIITLDLNISFLKKREMVKKTIETLERVKIKTINEIKDIIEKENQTLRIENKYPIILNEI